MAPKFLSRMDEAYQEKVVEYNPPTRVGYWIDKMEFIRGKMDMIKKKRARCETLTIRRNILFENLLKPSQLQQAKPYISYGDMLQITTDELQHAEYGIKPYVITSIITERDIDQMLNLCHGCPVVATLNRTPCRRNVLTIVDPKEGRSNLRVTYGKDIYFCIHDSGSERTLYLQALVPHFDSFGGPNEHYPLRLVECPDRYCKFKILHWDPDMRDVSLGDNVPSNTRVLIDHVVTNRYLVTERTYIPSLFGNEMTVSCYIYKNMGKLLPANFWELSIQKQKSLKKKNQS